MYSSALCFPQSLPWRCRCCPEDVSETASKREREKEKGKRINDAEHQIQKQRPPSLLRPHCAYACVHAAVRVKQAAWCTSSWSAATPAHRRAEHGKISEAHKCILWAKNKKTKTKNTSFEELKHKVQNDWWQKDRQNNISISTMLSSVHTKGEALTSE